MSLSIEATERIFKRLIATYGDEFTRKWPGVPELDQKTMWSHELASLATRAGYNRIAWALDNLPERAPNPIVFRNLCKLAPGAPEPVPALPAPANPARVAAEVAKLATVRAQVVSNGRDWAAELRRRVTGREVMPTQFQRACLTAVSDSSNLTDNG